MAEPAAAPLRVLYCTAETHPSFRADVATLFGKYLPRQGVQADLLTLHHQSPPPAWGGGQLLSRPGPARGARRHLLGLLNDLRMLWLARRGYQLVLVRDKSLGGLIGLMAARMAGIPFAYWMSFPMAEAWAVFARERGLSVGLWRWLAAKGRAGALRWLLYRVVLRGADHVFVQSETMRAEVAARGVPAACMSAVPMGVDTEQVPGPAARPAAQPGGGFVFAYLGTLNRLRQPELMIEALALLRARGLDARLLLIGDAEEEADRRWLRGLVERLGMQPWVEITGWLPVAAGLARCASADAGLSPFPRTELLESASPTKVVEYFHLGLPVIANDQPDQAALLQAAGGRCAELSAAGFAEAMEDLMRRPDWHRSVAQAGQALVRRSRSYEVLSAQTAACLREIVARAGAVRG